MNLKQSIILVCSLSLIIISCKESKKEVVIQKKVTHAQPVDQFEYETPLCYNTGTFDTKKYSREQLEATLNLWSTELGSPLHRLYSKTLINNIPENYFIKNVEELDRQYLEGKTFYKQLNYIHTPFWDKVYKEKTKELDEVYALLKTEAIAFRNPEVLIDSPYAKYCSEYTSALVSNDSTVLLNAWQKLAEEMAKKNGAPDVFWKRHNKLLASEDKLLYAKLYLLGYGWNNCANNYVFHTDTSLEYENEFEKLFIKVTSECDE